ncbi:MFS transporter [Paenibacillus sp. NPDC057967]|uniref:MFS transporter n=1 Tax=Paenibacillus sp. NPDC057967 TaxID=3346293 RepID=UPI0036DEB0F5
MLKKNRSFAKMFAAYGLAAFGDYFDFMAVSILLGFIWKADAMTLALVPLSFAVPSILFSQLAGILADRWNKRNLMIATDLIRAMFTILLIFAPNAWVLLGLITIRSTARVFHYPAQQAMTRNVVAPDQLLQATSLNGAVFQLSKVLGPLLGASVAAALSPSACMAVNAVCYILSALLLLRIPVREGRTASADSSSGTTLSLRAAWRDGWHLLLSSRTLQVSLLFCLIGLAGIQMIDAQITVLLRDIAPDQPQLVGWLVTAIGLGGLTSVAWLRRFQQLSAYGWLLGGGVLLIGVMFAAAGLFQPESPIWLLLCASFVGGIGTGFTSTGMNYILQKETPPDAIGRVSGIFDSLSSVIFVIAPLSGGILIGLWGASTTFLYVGLSVGGIGLIGLVIQRLLWSTDRPAKKTTSMSA